MNSTNILLGSTGFLLVVALLFSFTKMNEGKNGSSPEIAALEREIERLDEEQRELRNQAKKPTHLIFPQTPYQPTSIAEADGSTKKRMEELEEQMRQMTEDNNNLQDQLADANRSETILPEIDDTPAPLEEADPNAERRARLIRNALLQATVVVWEPNEYFVILEPAARSNFDVGDELALRRNDGILCRFVVTRESQGQFVATLKSSIAAGAPDIAPNDELILPPAYDGVPD